MRCVATLGAALLAAGSALGGEAPPIAAWGDSLTLGFGAAPGEDYPALAASLFSPTRIVENHGIGGQTSTQIAARLNALPVAATVSGLAVPPDGPVPVDTLTVNIVLDTAFGRASVAGTLCGVRGTLATHPLQITFTREVPGTAVPCPAASTFVPDLSAATRRGTVWLWLGRNGADPGHTIEADVAAAVARLGLERSLVASVLTAGTDSDAQLEAIAGINARLAAAYGARYVDVLADLLAAGNGSPGDAADVARGIVPRSLRWDFVHLTRRGNEIVAAAMVRATERLGL